MHAQTHAHVHTHARPNTHSYTHGQMYTHRGKCIHTEANIYTPTHTDKYPQDDTHSAVFLTVAEVINKTKGRHELKQTPLQLHFSQTPRHSGRASLAMWNFHAAVIHTTVMWPQFHTSVILVCVLMGVACSWVTDAHRDQLAAHLKSRASWAVASTVCWWCIYTGISYTYTHR